MFNLIKEILKSFNSLNSKCRFADPKCKAFNKGGLLKCTCGKKGKAPSAPAYQIPGWASGLPEEQLALIRAQVGKEAPVPGEFDIASQALQGLLGTQAEQFQLPIQQIQDALSAQQGIQYQDYLDQIRPIMAAQGQLDSSSYTNRISDFLQGQQAQSYGTTADLLTQQALQNLDLQKWIPQFQSGIAGQLAGLGGQRSALDQFNLTLPFQTTIPALGNVYEQGLSLGDRNTQQANMQYQSDLQSYMQKEQQKAQLYQSLGQLGMAGLTGGLSGAAGLLGTGTGFGGGFLQGLSGTAPSSMLLNKFQELGGTELGGTGNYRQRFNWTTPSYSPLSGKDDLRMILGF